MPSSFAIVVRLAFSNRLVATKRIIGSVIAARPLSASSLLSGSGAGSGEDCAKVESTSSSVSVTSPY